MHHYGASLRSSPASSADFSSPALPELSLDASLQRLHQDEDNSSASVSSIARSKVWLHSRTFEHEFAQNVASPPTRHHSHPSLDSMSSEASSAYRFPSTSGEPRAPSHSPSQRVIDVPSYEPATQARPRTSRGLSTHKPFLSSSSRATSIASIAEVTADRAEQPHPNISFGTPFADHAFAPHLQQEHDDDTTTTDPHRATSLSSTSSPNQDYRRGAVPAPPGIAKVAANLHASPASPPPEATSAWTILFAPFPQDSNETASSPNTNDTNFLLPLCSSIHDQTKLLKHHLGKQSNAGSDDIRSGGQRRSRDCVVECYLDLGSVSVLDTNAFARITPQSWSIIFKRYIQEETAQLSDVKSASPLPYLNRETGLPIVAVIRYRLRPASQNASPLTPQNLRQHQTVQTSEPPKSGLLKRPDFDQDNFRAWGRRESEMTVSLATAGRIGVSSAMAPSRSYPGNPRTPLRKSPLPYSPRTAKFPYGRPSLSAAMMSNEAVSSSDLAHHANARLGSAENKLRSLSLAAAYPLAAAEGNAAQPYEHAEATSPKSKNPGRDSRKAPSGLAGASGVRGESGDAQGGIAESRGYQQSSRGSSHKSFPSHGTSFSTHSTRSTSIYSSLGHMRTQSGQDDSDTDSDHDVELGRQFWTQLSNLGEQVSREKEDGPSLPFPPGRDGARNVSISSAVSEASSVFEFSPLGILVPTDDVDMAPSAEDSTPSPRIGSGLAPASCESDGRNQLNAFTPATDTDSSQPSLVLSRRRAYSSMVPLTGWRAGDADLLRNEERDADSISQLPHILLLESRGDASTGVDHSDLITPTVTTFQGRARAQSFQPNSNSSWPPEGTYMASPGARSARSRRSDPQDIWHEAVHQLKERIGRSEDQAAAGMSRSKRPSFSPRVEASASRSSAVSAHASSPTRSREASASIPEAVSPQVESSPLPGLFYETWVERADGGVDGDLGRRGSAFQVSPQDHPATLPVDTNLRPRAMSPSTSASSGATMLGSESAGSESSLRVLRDSDWPVPHTRPPLPRSTTGTVLPSASFLSVSSPLLGFSSPEAHYPVADREKADSDAVRARLGSSPMLRALTAPTNTSLASEGEGKEREPAPDDLIAGWAELAQRLESPGSMRLLCLAASNLSPTRPRPPEATSSGTALMIVPSSESIVALGSASVSIVPSATFGPASAGGASIVKGKGRLDLEAGAGFPRPRRLARKKATMLGPIRISPPPVATSDEVQSAGEELEYEEMPARAATRVKRSLSNIFELPSPYHRTDTNP